MNAQTAVRIEKWNYVIGAIGSLIAVALLSPEQGMGVAVGALLSALNFSVLRRLLLKVAQSTAKGESTKAAVLILPKMVGLLGAITIILLVLPVSPLFVALGFSTFFVSIGIESVRFLFTPA
jgi:hypothetical protein